MSKETVLGRMKEEGLRLTPQRVHIVELLFELSHPTADRIYGRLAEKFPYVSPATVYNTLNKLKEIGIVRGIVNGDKSVCFEWAGSDHWHFTCQACGTIYDLEPNGAEAMLAVGTNRGAFRVHSCQVEFHGVCAACSDEM